MPFLKEIYTPLKTFIPGSGGGINQNNYSITPTNGLLSSVAGDSQGRAKLNWTMPIIESIEKHRFIFYFDRLDFSAFYNYGGAWNQSVFPKSSTRLRSAHGYNLDLQFENKGVKLSAGLGVGQLVGRPFEVFAKFSFDNFF
jgi:outer membrane protein assembly factor BamA